METTLIAEGWFAFQALPYWIQAAVAAEASVHDRVYQPWTVLEPWEILIVAIAFAVLVAWMIRTAPAAIPVPLLTQTKKRIIIKRRRWARSQKRRLTAFAFRKAHSAREQKGGRMYPMLGSDPPFALGPSDLKEGREMAVASTAEKLGNGD